METAEFYKEEIRCGWKVDEKTKKVWAVQLEMLDEVERICKKYGLKYFADSGTLIGAVRHQAYIPWDDDIDLVMLREDYETFLKVAPGELKEYLVLQTPYREKNYLRAHAQLRNSRTTGCSKEDRMEDITVGFSLIFFHWMICLRAVSFPRSGRFPFRRCGRCFIPGTGLTIMKMPRFLGGS